MDRLRNLFSGFGRQSYQRISDRQDGSAPRRSGGLRGFFACLSVDHVDTPERPRTPPSNRRDAVFRTLQDMKLMDGKLDRLVAEYESVEPHFPVLTQVRVTLTSHSGEEAPLYGIFLGHSDQWPQGAVWTPAERLKPHRPGTLGLELDCTQGGIYAMKDRNENVTKIGGSLLCGAVTGPRLKELVSKFGSRLVLLHQEGPGAYRPVKMARYETDGSKDRISAFLVTNVGWKSKTASYRVSDFLFHPSWQPEDDDTKDGKNRGRSWIG